MSDTHSELDEIRECSPGLSLVKILLRKDSKKKKVKRKLDTEKRKQEKLKTMEEKAKSNVYSRKKGKVTNLMWYLETHDLLVQRDYTLVKAKMADRYGGYIYNEDLNEKPKRLNAR